MDNLMPVCVSVMGLGSLMFGLAILSRWEDERRPWNQKTRNVRQGAFMIFLSVLFFAWAMVLFANG